MNEELRPGGLWRGAQKKRHHRHWAQQQPTISQPVFVCVDWGASYWRQFTSLLGVSPPEPSLVVYNRDTKEFITGQKASDAWLPNTSHVRFENLKRLFDEESSFLQEECNRIRELDIGISIEAVLEKWWDDRIGPLMKRVPPQETITFAIAHPAHFSPRSVQRLRGFFAKSRDGRTFQVIMSEESTAALHGSRYSGFKSGDIVLVVDGGKSTIDCACLEITSDDPSLTTIIFKTEGLSVGADYINQVARQHAKSYIQAYKENASQDIQELMTGDSFERALEAWWRDFEVRCKRHLRMCRQNSLLDKIIVVPAPGLMEAVEEASHELAQRTKDLIEGLISVIQQMTERIPTSILCVGGYCQSSELRSLLDDLQPPPQFERGDSDGNDVINGLRNLALHPKRAEWQVSPQHYLITQDCANEGREALLMCPQGESLAKSYERVRLQSPAEEVKARKQRFKTPYHMPGHLIAMDVWVDADGLGTDEDIAYEIEIRTAEMLKVCPNKQGFLVSDLKDTTLLQRYTVTLPDHYRELFRRDTAISMYVCITAEGQDIVITAMRPRDSSKTPEMEWMTLPEILGTFGGDSLEIFKTSIQVTAASRQGMIPCFDLL